MTPSDTQPRSGLNVIMTLMFNPLRGCRCWVIRIPRLRKLTGGYLHLTLSELLSELFLRVIYYPSCCRLILSGYPSPSPFPNFPFLRGIPRSGKGYKGNTAQRKGFMGSGRRRRPRGCIILFLNASLSLPAPARGN